MTQGCLSEYLITKHGNGKAVPSESGFIDNLYCEIRNIISSGSVTILIDTHTPVTHYAEGTLMPILIQRMVFDYVAKNAPFWIRPILKMVFGQLRKVLIDPEIRKNLAMVCNGHLFILFVELLFRF